MTAASPSPVTDAEVRVAAARQRLAQTVGTLQNRLDPRVVARETVDGITESSGKALRTGAETVQRNPRLVAGAAALLMVVLARKRIAGLLRRKKPAAKPVAQPQAERRVRLKPRPAPPRGKIHD